MLRARVTAQLSGQSSRLKPIAADERMTQPVGVNRDGTLSTYPPVYPVLTVNGKTGEVRLAAKDVGALPAETRIPQNTSDLNNDSGFIGRLVEDLENYYRKSETYTREEIDYRISLIPKFKISVVEALPTENISGTTVYLLKAGNTSGDLYTEYIFTGGAWEILGSQRVDLTGYAKETWVSDLLKGYAKQTEFDALAGKAEETASRTIPTYVLAEGETPEDAPEWAEEVIDPYNDPEGGGYVLTDEDKQEIAEIAAGMVDIPGGGGSEETYITLVEDTLEEAVTTYARAITEEEALLIDNAKTVVLSFNTNTKSSVPLSGVYFGIYQNYTWKFCALQNINLGSGSGEQFAIGLSKKIWDNYMQSNVYAGCRDVSAQVNAVTLQNRKFVAIYGGGKLVDATYKLTTTTESGFPAGTTIKLEVSA